MSEVPLIYAKMHAIMDGIKGVAKGQHAPMGYDFRGIDDAYDAAQPQFVKHGVICLPEIISTVREARKRDDGKLMIWTIAEMKYTFYCVEDGSNVSVSVAGEGMDYGGDKATPCAMSTAYKTMMWQTFCIRVQGQSYDTEARQDTQGPSSAPRPPRRATAAPAAPTAPQQAGATPACPKCGGPMWDNSADREKDQAAIADGSRTAKARPAFKCKDKENCDGIVWSRTEGKSGLAAGRHNARRAPEPPAAPPADQGDGPWSNSAPLDYTHSKTPIEDMDMATEICEALDNGLLEHAQLEDACDLLDVSFDKWFDAPSDKLRKLHKHTAGKLKNK